LPSRASAPDGARSTSVATTSIAEEAPRSQQPRILQSLERAVILATSAKADIRVANIFTQAQITNIDLIVTEHAVLNHIVNRARACRDVATSATSQAACLSV
jgi:hypothetical protein